MFFLYQTGIAFPKKIVGITLVMFIENIDELTDEVNVINHIGGVFNFEMIEHDLEKSPASKEISMRMH